LIASENVGIGTTSPSSPLHLSAVKNDGWVAQLLNTGTGSDANGVLIKAGVDDADLILRLQQADGGAILDIKHDGRGLSQFTAKAWARFENSTLHDSHNCSSVSQSGNTGYYAITFTNAMANANYAVAGMAHADRMLSYHSQPTASQKLYMWSYNSAGNAENGDYQSVSSFWRLI
jgi:hypothetical protein